MRVSELADKKYRDQTEWNRMALVNIAKSGRFAADRAIKEYADNIWHMTAIKKEK